VHAYNSSRNGADMTAQTKCHCRTWLDSLAAVLLVERPCPQAGGAPDS
jgi:hypothetical protein